jgi:glycosyltransferase involved in cell wall biosynthesis
MVASAHMEENATMVSVAMATYNGEGFLSEQLDSIVSQLGSTDEVIIVDDASRDATCAIVEGFRDPRIRLIRNETNRGVLASFETALRNTTGEIIFLSDQDDVWHPDKVDHFLHLFKTRPKVTLVMSDARIIDGDGRVISQSRLNGKDFNPRVLSNLVRNGYLGCAIAFRRDTLHYCLPFPRSIPMHDMWIGILNQMYGEMAFLREPLLSHRRHGDNASPDTHASYSQMFRWRTYLIFNLIRRRLTVGRKAETRI